MGTYDGLTYAGGPLEIRHGKPASAFARGAILQFTSGSSLSHLDTLQTASCIIAGVALSSSTESVGSKVPYIVAQPLTRFWITATTAAANAAQRGTTSDVSVSAVASTESAFEYGTSGNSSMLLVRSESSTDASIVQRDKESANSWVIVSIVSTTLGSGAHAIG